MFGYKYKVYDLQLLNYKNYTDNVCHILGWQLSSRRFFKF